MRVAVVGGGYWGSKHVRVLAQMSEVDRVLLVEPSAERRSALTRSFSNVTAADLGQALDEADAVVVATPPRTHVGLALQALSAGKSVLVEKPLALSTRDASRLITAAEDADLTLMVGHTFRFNAAVWKLRELILGDELGDLFYIDSARLNLGLYQDDVNVLWDLAPHDISIFNFLLGATPTAVQAWGSAHTNLLEDVASVRLTYDEPRVVAQAHVSWLDPCKVRRVTVVGSRKMGVYNDLSSDEPIRLYDKGVHRGDLAPSRPLNRDGLHSMPLSYRHGGIVSPYVPFDEPLQVQDHHFVECVLTGAPAESDGAEGMAVVEVLEAAETSLRTGSVVPLSVVPLSAPAPLLAAVGGQEARA